MPEMPQELDQNTDVINVVPPHAISILQSENYRIRYVELIRTIGGAFLAWIYLFLSRNGSITGAPLMLASSTIANFMAWVIGEQIIHRLCLYFNLYTETRSRNPLYRNFKTLASLGFSLGILLAMCGSIFDIKTDVSLLSASVAFVAGLSAFGVYQYRKSLPLRAEHQKSIDEQLGTEGWSKYTKLALTMGTSIGQIMGGYVAYSGGYDTLSSWTTITLYGAVVSTISFFAMAICVPLINYFTRGNRLEDRGILVCENRDAFNTNYMRSGMTLGVTIGTILGGFLAPLIISGLPASVGIAIGAGVISIITGVTLGVYGHSITLYFQNNWGISANTDNNWSFASRNTSMAFGFVGTGLACVFCPGAALLEYAAMGSAATGFIGWFVGLGIMWKARRLEPMEDPPTKLPWTQRISTGSTRGATIGAFTGLAIAVFICSGGALGLTGMITLGYALGGVIGGMYEGFDDEVARRMMIKIWYGDDGSPSSAIIESYSLTLQRLNEDETSQNLSGQELITMPINASGTTEPCYPDNFNPIFHKLSNVRHTFDENMPLPESLEFTVNRLD